MDDSTLDQYLADDPPAIVTLEIRPHFDALTDREKKYSHYVSRAAFAGTRMNLRQVSPESEAIYDLILALYRHCKGGDWKALQSEAGVAPQHLKHFLDFAAQFLGNTG